jgi:hypothetical protein
MLVLKRALSYLKAKEDTKEVDLESSDEAHKSQGTDALRENIVKRLFGVARVRTCGIASEE